jgi:hypothetical protein
MFCDGTTADGCWIEDMDEIAEGAPFVANIDWGRALLSADIGSALLEGHGPVLWGFFRAAVAFHPPFSVLGGIDIPFVCGVDCVIVAVEDEEFEAVDEFDRMEEEELARCALFRGMNIRATSSAFIELRPP